MQQVRRPGFWVWLTLMAPACLGATALQEYVSRPDPHFAWRVVDRQPLGAGTCIRVELSSQAWRVAAEVDRPVWRHRLVIYAPPVVTHRLGLLWIGGGNNHAGPPRANAALQDIARRTATWCAELHTVPNQPLTFAADPAQQRRTEDDILAYAWARYLETGDPEWLALLPMTKSAVRALDVLQALSRDPAYGAPPLEGFVVTGASKRGWTTWLTAAVDSRVVAIAPAVIDLLNLRPSMRHHHAAYGRYAPAITPYVTNGVLAALDSPAAAASLGIIDPYSYRRSLTLPKLLLNSTGDQFFLPDSSRFYLADLRGPTFLRYLPNTDHGLNDSARDTLASFYTAVLTGRRLPRVTTRRETPETLAVQSDTPARRARLWQAHNPEARDFRLETLGPVWRATELTAEPNSGGRRYRVHLEPPVRGWRAGLLALTFPDPNDPERDVTLTSEVLVVPETLPFGQKDRTATTGK